jgi:hypothetical protein
MIMKYLPVYQQCKCWKESTVIPGKRQRYTKRSENGHKKSLYGRMVKRERLLTRKHTGREEAEDGDACNMRISL